MWAMLVGIFSSDVWAPPQGIGHPGHEFQLAPFVPGLIGHVMNSVILGPPPDRDRPDQEAEMRETISDVFGAHGIDIELGSGSPASRSMRSASSWTVGSTSRAMAVQAQVQTHRPQGMIYTYQTLYRGIEDSLRDLAS